jgi:hypothetical protein
MAERLARVNSNPACANLRAVKQAIECSDILHRLVEGLSSEPVDKRGVSQD